MVNSAMLHAGEQFEHLDSKSQQMLAEEILLRLGHESTFLNRVIEETTRLGKLLSNHSTPNRFATNQSQIPESGGIESRGDESLPAQELESLRNGLLAALQSQREHRHALQGVIQQLSRPSQVASPSLRAFAKVLPDRQRESLNRLRLKIRQQIREVNSVMLGNQAALIYGIEFYQAMLQGLVGERSSESGAYNAQGQVKLQSSQSIVQTKC